MIKLSGVTDYYDSVVSSELINLSLNSDIIVQDRECLLRVATIGWYLINWE